MRTNEAIDLPQKCMDEATRLFVAHGYNGISMREIAEQVGVSKAGLYYHFRDKEALFLAILTANLGEIEAIVTDAKRSESGARQRITLVMHGIAARAPEQRAIIRLASQEMVNVSPEAREAFGRTYHEKFIGQIQSIITDGIAAGDLRPVDASDATWILLGMMYPFLYTAHESPLTPTAGAIDLMVAIFFDGLASRPAASA